MKITSIDDEGYTYEPINNYIDDENNSINIYLENTYIYGWGRNTYGEIGVGSNENVFLPSPIKSLNSQIITSICSGGKNTMILTDEGKIYLCGSSMFGMLGDNSYNEGQKFKNKFKQLTSFENNDEIITKISCAEFHSLCLNNKGQVFTWGGNLYNKLGQQTPIQGMPLKVTSLLTRKIIEISCGDHHSCALASTGELFTWGGGGKSYNRGQCGHGNVKDIDQPKRVDYFKNNKVIKVSCGGYHTIVLCENGNLFGFGKGDYGQCGYGESQDTTVPKLIKFNLKMIRTYEKEIIDKNHNEDNFIPFTSSLRNPNKIEETTTDIQIIDIKCGGEHSMILSKNGRVYTFGHGYTGQLGLGNSKNSTTPMIVKSLTNKSVNQIAAGWSHSMVLTSEGNLYVCGCGKFGELGLNESDNNMNKYNFTFLKSASKLNITNIFAGGHHSWILVDNITPERIDFEMPEPLEPSNYLYMPRDNTPNKRIYKESEEYVDPNSFEEQRYNFVLNKDSYDALKRGNYKDNQSKMMLNTDERKYRNTTPNEQYDINKQKDTYNQSINSKIPKRPRSKQSSYQKTNENEINTTYPLHDKEFNPNQQQYSISSMHNRSNVLNDMKHQYNIESINKESVLHNDNNNNNSDRNYLKFELMKHNVEAMTHNKLQIQIIFTDVVLSHRFVRFEMSYKNKFFNTPLKEIEMMFANYFAKDIANIKFRLEDDKTAISYANNHQQTISPIMEILFRNVNAFKNNNEQDPNIRKFSLLILYDYSKNKITQQIKDEIAEAQENENIQSQFNIIILSDDDINNDPNESILSGWVNDLFNNFYELFKEDSTYDNNNSPILIPRFLEIRPNSFSINLN